MSAELTDAVRAALAVLAEAREPMTASAFTSARFGTDRRIRNAGMYGGRMFSRLEKLGLARLSYEPITGGLRACLTEAGRQAHQSASAAATR